MAQNSLENLIEMKQQRWKSSVNALCDVKHYYTFANKQHIYCEAVVSYVSTYTMKHLEKKKERKGATYQNASYCLFTYV